MNNKYDLYGGIPPHQQVDTSVSAAIQIEADVSTLQGRVLQFIKNRKSFGATDEEIQHALGMKLNTEVPRRRELELKGIISDSGKRRLNTSKREAIVWMYNPTEVKTSNKKESLSSRLKAKEKECRDLQAKLELFKSKSRRNVGVLRKVLNIHEEKITGEDIAQAVVDMRNELLAYKNKYGPLQGKRQ